jgi:hypothetical protein
MNATFWNVSFMATREDNGCCLTFRTEKEARDALAALMLDGVYHAVIWTA